MERDRYTNINERQMKLELPDSIGKQLAEHAELLGLTEAQAIVHLFFLLETLGSADGTCRINIWGNPR